MNAYDFVLLILKATGGQIEGRTKLQKIVYFAAVNSGNVDDLGYRAHYYGPYSSAVAEAVSQLRSLGFVSEEKRGSSSGDAHGFEIIRHDYRLTDDGAKIADAKALRHSDIWNAICTSIEKTLGRGDVSYVKLSIAAKVFHILTESGKPLTRQNILDAATGLGWQIDQSDLDEAIEYVKSMGLVEAKH